MVFAWGLQNMLDSNERIKEKIEKNYSIWSAIKAAN